MRRQSVAETLDQIAKHTAECDRWPLFPLYERNALSYILAESAILLLGTSWLSTLSCTNIIELQGDNADAYLLGILESDQRRSQLLVELKAYADGSTSNVGVLEYCSLKSDSVSKSLRSSKLILKSFWCLLINRRLV
jgi:hypothetical protein